MAYYVELQISPIALFVLVQSRFGQGNRSEGTAMPVGNRLFRVSKVDVQKDTAFRYTEQTTTYIFYQSYLQHGLQSVPLTTTKLQLTQSIVISLDEQVQAPDGTVSLQPAGTYPLQALLWLNAFVFDLGASDSMPYLTLTLEHMTPNFQDPVLGEAVTDFASQLFTSVSAPLPLYGKANYLNAGVSMDSQQSCVAVRIELGVGNEDNPAGMWQPFYAGTFRDYLNTERFHPWVVMVNKDLVTQGVQESFGTGLNEPTAKLRLQGGIDTAWVPSNGTGAVDVSFHADAVNACPDYSDIGVYVTAHLTLDIARDQNGNPTSNVLESKAHVDWDADDLDVVKCGLVFGALGALEGVGIGAFFGPSGIAVGAIVGFAVGFFGVIIGASVYAPPIQQPYCIQIDKHNLDCLQPINMGMPKSGKKGQATPIQITEVYGVNDGMVLAGQLDLEQLNRVQSAELEVQVEQFEWRPPGISCGELGPNTFRDIEQNIKDEATAVAQILLTNTGTLALKVQEVTIVSKDPIGIFTNGLHVYVYDDSATVEIDCHYDAQYFSHPYPCQVLVATNGGSKIVTLNPIPDLTDAVIKRLLGEVANMIGRCHPALDDWWRHFQRFNLKWLVDPPPMGEIVDRWHMAEVSGIGKGEHVRLDDGSGQTVGLAVAQTQGVARIGFLSAAGSAELGLTRVDQGEAIVMEERTLVPGADPGIRIRTRQTEIIMRGTLSIGQVIRQIGAVGIGGVPHLLVLTDSGVHTFSLADPARPRPGPMFTARGLRGFVLAGRSLLLYGEAGLSLFALDGTRMKVRKEGFQTAVTLRDHVAGIRDGHLEILHLPHLATIESPPIEEVHAIAATSRHLIHATKQGLEAFELGREGQLIPVGAMRVEGVESLSTQPQVYPRTAVYAGRADGGGELIDFASPGRPEVVLAYEQRPWFHDTARQGPFFLRLQPDGTSVSIATIGRSATV